MLETPVSGLTISPLSWWDIDFSGDIYCNYVNAGPGAALHGFRLPPVFRKQVLFQRVRSGPKLLGRE